MSLDITIGYKLTGKGWAQCNLDVYGAQCLVTASYLSDPLCELINGVNHILGAGDEARFSFDEEPGEYRWILQRTADGGLGIKILEFPELWGGKPDADGKVLIDVICPTRVFAAALLLSLNELLDEYGIAGYQDKWSQSGFPIRQYEALCAHLGEPLSSKLKIDNRHIKRSKLNQ